MKKGRCKGKGQEEARRGSKPTHSEILPWFISVHPESAEVVRVSWYMSRSLCHTYFSNHQNIKNKNHRSSDAKIRV
jgi:hypothetical protein